MVRHIDILLLLDMVNKSHFMFDTYLMKFLFVGAQWINPESSEAYKTAYELPMGKNGKNNIKLLKLKKNKENE